MIQKGTYNLLVIDEDSSVIKIIEEIGKKIDFLKCLHVNRIADVVHSLLTNQMDAVILNQTLNNIPVLELQKIINEIVTNIPIVLLGENSSLLDVDAKNGFFYLLEKPFTKKKIEDMLIKIKEYLVSQREKQNKGEDFSDLELKLNEDAIILKTTLDILAHDTKNLFTTIFALLVDLPGDDISNSLTKHINELYSLISEALGYISYEKRIFSLVDMINSINLGKERIPLSEYNRIKLSYSSRKLFFIETCRVFKNVLSNVIENALKYSDSTKDVFIIFERDGDYIQIKIIDRGMGIKDDEKTKVFNWSYRGKSVRHIEGSGKGLWIARNIVKKEGGSIWIEDNPEGGTIIIITIPAFHIMDLTNGFNMLEEWYGLPLEEIEKEAKILRGIFDLEFGTMNFDINSLVFANLLDELRNKNVHKESGRVWNKLNKFKSKNTKGKKVLLVDDSLHVHYKIAPLLIEQGWRIVGYALNGKEAINLYKKLRPDVTIIDVTMPIMSGMEAAKKIIEQNSDAKFIFSTALGKDKILLNDLKERFLKENYLVVTKPFKAEELIHAINKLF